VFLKNSVLRCFSVFCGVFRCFVCVFLRFSQNSTKQTKKYTKRTKRTKCALCNTTQYGAVHLSLTQKMSTKNIRKTRPKHCKTSAKHRKTLFFLKHSQNIAKHPQNTRKTPQNTAIHHKTHLRTKHTELANKPLRSRGRKQKHVTERPSRYLCRSPPVAPATRRQARKTAPGYSG